MSTTAAPESPSVPMYTYKRYDPSNNIIQCEENPSLPVFTTTQTMSKGLMKILRSTAVVCETGGDKSVKIQGEIDWKNKTIAVEGVSKALSAAKQKIGGTFSSDTEWTWPSGKYTINHKSGEWTVRRADRELAVYTSLKLGVFRFSKHAMATLKFLAEISHEEKVFLILILMFYDFQKTVEEPMSLKELAVEGGVNAAVTVTGNVVSGCCVVQ
ncbi:hypothetical protein Agabi119p4_6034 [Agaricus bisporus var. burnettii]|uniref:Uncharacterized protein n=1 Tax=Agaricus bisporus var. burnettii TaxID=192524 RepID=A0A8H7F109_AGABI|nr:hypothetical protein Agabi119p4_6034 [Agaricus bisporus var. burnettii]